MERDYKIVKSLDTAISKSTGNNYVVAQVVREDTSGIHFRFLIFKNFQSFKTFYNNSSVKSFHEILKSRDQISSAGFNSGLGRLVFDLDLKDKIFGSEFVHPTFDQDFVECIKTTFRKYYTNVNLDRLDFIWMSCLRADKYSRHLVIKGALLPDFRIQMEQFYQLFLHEMKNMESFYYIPEKYFKYTSSLIDHNIIHGTYLRMVGSQKNGHMLTLDPNVRMESIFEISKSYELEDTLVRPLGTQVLINEQQICHVNDTGLQLLRSMENARNAPDQNIDDQNEYIHLDTNQIITLLMFLSVIRAANTKLWRCVGACLKQLSDSNEVFNAWVEWSRTPSEYRHLTTKYYQNVWKSFNKWKWTPRILLNWVRKDSYEKFKEFLTHNPGIKFKTQYVHKSYKPPRHFRIKVDQYHSDVIKPFHNHKILEVVNSKMDTQKTRTLLKYIRENIPGLVVVTTSREKFARNVDSLFRDNLPGYTVYSYLNIKDWGKIEGKAIIIIQMESLHKLKYKIPVPDLLVMDEVTACLAQFSSDTMHSFLPQVMPVFEAFLRQSKKIIAMDADVDDRIMDLLLKLRTETIYLQWNTIKYIDRRMTYFSDYHFSIYHLIQRLKSGENIYIVCSSNNLAHKLEKIVKDMRLAVRCHTSDESALDRDALDSVNDLWIQYRVVIITSTITNGIDFNRSHFHSMFVFADPRCCPVRDVKQMMGRVRKLSTGLIFSHIQHYSTKFPISYDSIKLSLLNRKTSYLTSLNDITKDPSHPQTFIDNAQNMFVRLSANKVRFGSDGILCDDFSDDDWFTSLHIRNIQERNLSSNFFYETFVHMMVEQGIPFDFCNYSFENRPELGGKDAFDRFNTMLDGVKFMLEIEKNDKYMKAPLISHEQSIELKKKIDERTSTADEQYFYEVYTVNKYFKDKLSFSFFEFFKLKKTQCINAKLELDGTLHKVLELDRSRVQLHQSIKGRLDRFVIIKEFCQRLNLKNTLTVFFFDSRIVNNNPDDWYKFGTRIQHAFNFGIRPKKSNQSLMEIIKKMLKEWSRTRIGKGEEKESRKDGIHSKFTIYPIRPSEDMLTILTLMKNIDDSPLSTKFESEAEVPKNGMTLLGEPPTHPSSENISIENSSDKHEELAKVSSDVTNFLNKLPSSTPLESQPVIQHTPVNTSPHSAIFLPQLQPQPQPQPQLQPFHQLQHKPQPNVPINPLELLVDFGLKHCNSVNAQYLTNRIRQVGYHEAFRSLRVMSTPITDDIDRYLKSLNIYGLSWKSLGIKRHTLFSYVKTKYD